jgi:GNAT superfamily N-acetyltransferase
MDQFTVRDASPDEAPLIATMVRRMVADMASYGGHAPAVEEASWEKLAAGLAEQIEGGRVKYSIAVSAGGDWVGVAGAELITLGGAFAPKATLHVSAVYVVPQFRRRGVARALIARLLDWGRAIGAVECDLNVLKRNPAKELYEKHGFAVVEVKMIRTIQSG